jgi:hypothetical protein
MPVFKLADDHPLTKTGVRCVQLVETAERGLRVGDVVFEFPFGRIIDTGMACRRDGILPPGVDLINIHKEATAARAAGKSRDLRGDAGQRARRADSGRSRGGDRGVFYGSIK